MSKTGLFSILRPIVYCFRDGNGNFRTMPLKEFSGLDPNSQTILSLNLLLKLIFNTDFISTETKIYLSDRFMSAPALHQVLTETDPKYSKTKKDVANLIYRDQTRVARLVTPDELYKIAYKHGSASGLLERLSLEFCKLDKSDSVIQNLTIPLPKDVMSSKCDEDIFDDFLTRIAPYTKGYIENIINKLPKEAVGYFNYLMYNPMLSEQDKEKKDAVLAVLEASGDDYGNLDID